LAKPEFYALLFSGCISAGKVAVRDNNSSNAEKFYCNMFRRMYKQPYSGS